MLKGLQRRTNHVFFDETKIPSKELIHLIVQDAYKLVPLKNDLAWVKAKIFGPEFSVDKHRLCLQTVCDWKEGDTVIYTNDLYGIGREREQYIADDLMAPLLKYKEFKKRKQPSYQYEEIQFNTQLLAPWLIVFSCVLNDRGRVKLQEVNPLDIPEHNETSNIRNAHMQAAMLAYTIAGLANENNLDVGFCSGIFNNDYNPNKIIKKNEQYLVGLGIGVGDTQADMTMKDTTNRKEFYDYTKVFSFEEK